MLVCTPVEHSPGLHDSCAEEKVQWKSPQSASFAESSEILYDLLNERRPPRRMTFSSTNSSDRVSRRTHSDGSTEAFRAWLNPPLSEIDLTSRIRHLRTIKKSRAHIAPVVIPANRIPSYFPKTKTVKLDELLNRLAKPKAAVDSSYHPNVEIIQTKQGKLGEASFIRLSQPRTFESVFARFRSRQYVTVSPPLLANEEIESDICEKADCWIQPASPDATPYAPMIREIQFKDSRARRRDEIWLAEAILNTCNSIMKHAERVDESECERIDETTSAMISTMLKGALSPAGRCSPAVATSLRSSKFPKLSDSLEKVLSCKPRRLWLLRLCQLVTLMKHA